MPERYALSRVDWFRADGRNTDNHPCDVLIRPAGIVVSYNWNGTQYEVAGREVEPGHYELDNSVLGVRASLHRFEHGEVMVGQWHEAGWEYLWRVNLAD
jgi:hypothetical protein